MYIEEIQYPSGMHDRVTLYNNLNPKQVVQYEKSFISNCDYHVCTITFTCMLLYIRTFRSPFFSFDPDDMKKVSMSNDSLNKAMEHPISFEATVTARSSRREGPTSTEVVVTRRQRSRERRYSAPPSDRRVNSIRDSAASLDYLSESQGVCVCVCGCAWVWVRACGMLIYLL